MSGTLEAEVLDSTKIKIGPGDLVFMNDLHGKDNEFSLYVADQESDEVFEIYTYNASTSAVEKINNSLLGCSVLTGVTWTNDKLRIVYSGSQQTSSTNELFIAAKDGSGRVKLNQSMVALATAGNQFQALHWSTNTNRVVFSADQDTAGVYELYSVQSNGTNLVKLNDEFVSGGRIENAGDWHISPDGASVSYQADQDADNVVQLYVVPIDGSAASRMISNVQANGGDVVEHNWSETGSHLLYRADELTNNVFDLYRVRPDGAGANRVNPALVSGGNVTEFSWLRS